MKTADAQELFNQLETFSNRVFALWQLPGRSPNGAESLSAPKGVVIHYTAGTLESSVRWFCDPTQKSGVSAHVIVGRSRYAWAEPLLTGLPLLQALPVTVVQCRRPNEGAYHATWANRVAWGIENECFGRGPDGQGQNVPVKDPLGPRQYAIGPDVRVKLWDTYPPAQVAVNVTLIQAYAALAGASFSPSWVTGHENFETLATVGYPNNKLDPGPMYPLSLVRDAALGDAGKATLSLAATIAQSDPTYEAKARRGALLAPFVAKGTCYADAWGAALSGSLFTAADLPVVYACRALMGLLGYYVGADARNILWSDLERESLQIAQTALGLKVDGVAGPKTLRALQNRLTDRFG